MAGGYMGKLLFVDLTTGKIKEETPGESLYRDFIGGYGIGARILYSRQKAGADPLGPENTLGLITGPLTGTPATFGCRWVAVSKSPLTGGWGDSNCGGYFGPYLKFAGYDGVFISGVSAKPVYLLIDNGKAVIKDGSHLWGKNTLETEETLEAEYGPEARAICIGPAGERVARLACIINNRHDTAGRAGMGAVMGSKRLKAVVARGNIKVPVADPEAADMLRKEHIAEGKEWFARFGIYGTASHAADSAHSGDSPVKNWGGVGAIEMPDNSGLNKEIVRACVDKRSGCWHCPSACKATLKMGPPEFPYPVGAQRPEYESTAAFGAMCLVTDYHAIILANHLCNLYGLDTISTGTAIGFAMECYEHRIITPKDTGGIELTWGNAEAIPAMVEKIARREDIGDALADGVRIAAEKIGRSAKKYAVHIGGQELGLHDPKSCGFMAYRGKPMMAMYQMDATPGRHTTGFGPPQFMGYVLNAAGVCLHSNIGITDPHKYLAGFLSAVTGYRRSISELEKAGERIGNMRHVFSLREGDVPIKRFVHPRIAGRPPFKEGPLAGVTVDMEAQAYWNLGALDWDPVSNVPSRKKLLELGLDDIAEELWPPEKRPGPAGIKPMS
ncbi:MAG: aldehyde ferredoxin oxidoreductase family protein [Dehalococcoidales bacterium]